MVAVVAAVPWDDTAVDVQWLPGAVDVVRWRAAQLPLVVGQAELAALDGVERLDCRRVEFPELPCLPRSLRVLKACGDNVTRRQTSMVLDDAIGKVTYRYRSSGTHGRAFCCHQQSRRGLHATRNPFTRTGNGKSTGTIMCRTTPPCWRRYSAAAWLRGTWRAT